MRRNTASVFKLAIVVGTLVLCTLIYVRFLNSIYDENEQSPSSSDHQQPREAAHPRAGAFFSGGPKNTKLKLIDWHDYDFWKREQARTGLGEMGRREVLPVELNDEKDLLYRKNGFNALLSDKISVNRSVPDIRHPK